jgi:threonine aldolase
MQRRSLLASAMAAFAPQFAMPANADAGLVYATGDGIPHSPADYVRLLADLTRESRVVEDAYARGGAVEELETFMAKALGKESAVWLPTGTLANHLAIRGLAGNKRRVLVQHESHLFNDSGDCAQTLSGLTLVPLAPGKATFSLEDVERAVAGMRSNRVSTPVGALQIESPVRRRSGEVFDFSEMVRISAWARDHGVGLHLDGARLFIESAYTSRPVTQYTALFDTVYVSLYKYFNAGAGAILAGSKSFLADLYQTRRMFGGSVYHAWPHAAVALHYAKQFAETMKAAKHTADVVIAALKTDANFTVLDKPSGTNLFGLEVHGVNAPVYRDRLELAGIVAAAPQKALTLSVNPTWTRVPASEIVARFNKALG